jgi:hypothetical protein
VPRPQQALSLPVTASTARVPPSSAGQQSPLLVAVGMSQKAPGSQLLALVQLVKQLVVLAQMNGAQGTTSGLHAPDPLQLPVGPV